MNSFSRFLPWMTGIAAIAVVIWHNISIYPWMLDDAFILFRYAENFASGNGLVYNIGERVEGYTAFLWVIILGIGKIIGLNVVLLSKVLSALFALGTFVLVMISHKFIPGLDQKKAALSVLILGTCGIFTPWISSGMEVNLFIFLILLTLLLYIKAIYSSGNYKYHIITGFLLAVTVMTRPDGALLVILIFGDSFFRSIRERNLQFLTIALPAASIYLPYFIWRLFYYGYFMPNTFYAKVGYSMAQAIRGMEYFGDMVMVALPMIIFAVAGGIVYWQKRNEKGLYILMLFILLHSIYVVLVGGDCMPAFRFFVPIIPPLSILAVIGASGLSRRGVVVSIAVLIICGFNMLQIRNNSYIQRHILTDQVYLNGKQVGLWLKANFPAGTVIATNTGGSIPYYSGFQTVDMLGLNDEHIAHKEMSGFGTGMAGHEKGDGDYVLSRQPDIIQFYSSLGGIEPWFPTDFELYDNPQFHEQYKSVRVNIPELGEVAYFYIRRTDAP